MNSSALPRPYRIDIPASVLSDLAERLDRARWPDNIAGSGWAYGTDLHWLRDIADYWRHGYDWRRAEAMLNGFDQYVLPVGGIDLHFIHQRGIGPDPLPLLLMHGWPTSIVDFHKIIPMLTDPVQFGGDPDDAFTVIAPSLPGHGFSYVPGQRRFGIDDIADALAQLMADLGYSRFAAQGADWGAFIATRLGFAYPERMIGIFISLLAVPRVAPAGDSLTVEEQAFKDQLAGWMREETGYSLQMGTKPQTLAYALHDSPVGLAAWILEKYRSWSDCNGDVDGYFGRDTLLTNVMLYWVTSAINSSFWPYYARHHGSWIVPEDRKVEVPTGYAEFPREILTPPRSVAERYYADIRRWTRMSRGGHFPALEAPEALVHECREFFRPLRACQTKVA